jgi:hypothetical protein
LCCAARRCQEPELKAATPHKELAVCLCDRTKRVVSFLAPTMFAFVRCTMCLLLRGFAGWAGHQERHQRGRNSCFFTVFFLFCFVFGSDWGKKPARNLSIILSLLILNGCQMTNALLFSNPVIFFFERTLGVYLLLLQCCVDKTMKNCPKELISLRRITLKRSKAQNAN